MNLSGEALLLPGFFGSLSQVANRVSRSGYVLACQARVFVKFSDSTDTDSMVSKSIFAEGFHSSLLLNILLSRI